MQYKRQVKNNISISTIDTDRFKVNEVRFIFTQTTNGKDNSYSNLLTSVLKDTTKKYNTRIKLAKHLEELYYCNLNSYFFITGNIKSFVFSISFINSKYIEENIDNKAIDLLFEMIFNPNQINNSFEEKSFNLIKENILVNIKRINEFPAGYSLNEFLKIFNDKVPSKYPIYGNEKEIKNITSSSLFEYYKKIFDMNLDIVILGDFEKENLINYILKKLSKYNFDRKLITKINVENKIKNRVKIKKEIKNFNQSQLLVGYKFKDLTDYERKYVAPIYSIILGGDINSLLFVTLREKYGLCYGISSNYNRYENTLTINSGINKVNYDKALDLIKHCVKQMENKNIVSKLCEIAKQNIETSLNVFYDDASGMLSYAYSKNYEDILSVEERREMFKNVKVEQIINLNKKIKLDTIYFLEGEKE